METGWEGFQLCINLAYDYEIGTFFGSILKYVYELE